MQASLFAQTDGYFSIEAHHAYDSVWLDSHFGSYHF